MWLNNRHENLENIEGFNNPVEALLFKQAIALGWDCPRACVLLIFREMQSFVFTTQVVGRIMRMPEQHFYTNDALNYGYVYTNLSADKIQVVGDEMNYISTIYAKIREGLTNVMLPSVYQYDRKTRNRLGADFKKVLYQTLEKYWSTKTDELFSVDDFLSPDDKDELADEDARMLDHNVQVEANLEMARLRGIQMDVSKIRIPIPKDIKLTGDEGITEIVSKARIALTSNEVNALFLKFCNRNCGSFAKHDSAPVLYNALLNMMEKAFDKNEFDAEKIILWHVNQSKFVDLIKQALEEYAKVLELKERSRKEYIYKTNEWIVPETRMFNLDHYHSCEDEIFNHAMKPFFEQNRVSKPEQHFARWVDKQNEVVDWWYKNGDSGSENFAVPYTDKEGINRCFYVDFIIRLKNGLICLFDTKSCGSDDNAPVKHNALLKYIDEQREKGKKLVGGVVIEDLASGNWYYPSLPIDNTNDLTGWDNLDLVALNKINE